MHPEYIKNFHKSIRKAPKTQWGNDWNRLLAKEDTQKAKRDEKFFNFVSLQGNANENYR